MFGQTLPRDSWANAANASLADARSISNVNNITFYNYLPDLSISRVGENTFGLFDHNIADPRLLPAGASVPSIDNFGMAIDWANLRYFTGFLDWEGKENPDGLRGELVVSFGRVTPTGTGPLLQGSTFEALTLGGSDEIFLRSGASRAGEYVYGPSPNSPISGMILETVLPVDTTTSPFAADVVGERLLQPLVKAIDQTRYFDNAPNRPNETVQGFAAGFITKDANGAAGSTAVKTYWNTAIPGVKIQKDATNNRVGANVALFETANTGSTIDASFGANNTSQEENAYITHDLYAAQQGKVVIRDTGSTTAQTISGPAGRNGVLVSAEAISNTKYHCTKCDHVEWGVWAADIKRGEVNGVPIVDVANMVPYVAGEVTTNLASAVPSGTFATPVTYSGPMYGATLDNTTITRHEGNFDARINLNTRQLTDFDARFAGMRFGFAGKNYTIPTSGAAQFAQLPVENTGAGSATEISGKINGVLFGPQAQDIGGNFAVQNVDNIQATGVYLGTRE